MERNETEGSPRDLEGALLSGGYRGDTETTSADPCLCALSLARVTPFAGVIVCQERNSYFPPAFLKGSPADLCFSRGSRHAWPLRSAWKTHAPFPALESLQDGVTLRKRGGADGCLHDPKLPSVIARRLVSGSTSRCVTGCCDMSDAAIFSLNRQKKNPKKLEQL